MKKLSLILFIWLGCCLPSAFAANLIEVYQQALISDPIFQQAVSQSLSTKEGLAINIATLLPNIQASINPSVSRQGYAGSLYRPAVPGSGSGTYLNPRNQTMRGVNLNLSLTQTLFSFAAFSQIAQQVSLSRQADATLNAALQNLILRVATAYFTILNDEDDLDYAAANKLSYAEQLDHMQQQYKVGLKTQTDVYTAQASYDSAVATVIAAETKLANDRENLRVITGVYYEHLDSLSNQFPLAKPQPENVDRWVQKTLAQNWSIKAAQYNLTAARDVVRQQLAGHFPTLTGQIDANKALSDNINQYNAFNERPGVGTFSNRTIQLTLNIPIFAGGGVIAQTNQAKYNWQVARQQLEQTTRSVVNNARQSYLNVVAGISKINADKETIKSASSSLKGLELSYDVGMETLVNVLDQQQKVFNAQREYARDRYTFINNSLALKQAAGTLSFEDLHTVNDWLENKQRKPVTKPSHKHTKHKKKHRKM